MNIVTRSTLIAFSILCALRIGEVLADTAKAIEAFKAGNYAEAEREARAAIANGEGRGYEVLAGLMMARRDREPDVDGAIAVLREASRAGWLRANIMLANLLRTLGRSSGKFAEDESFALLREAAERGFPPAQYFVAKEYEFLFGGYQRPEDRAAALRWFREAVKSATSVEMEEISVTGEQAYCDVAWRIENTLRSPEDAVPWYRRCAEVGCHTGMEKLAEIYQSGSHGEHLDPARAARWRLAAESAKPEACLNN